MKVNYNEPCKYKVYDHLKKCEECIIIVKLLIFYFKFDNFWNIYILNYTIM
jgi:hypothetical protein